MRFHYDARGRAVSNPTYWCTIAVSGLIGALAVSFLFVLWTWIFQPAMFNDGQYMIVFFFTFPFGWLLGSATGTLLAYLSREIARPGHPVWISVGLILGGVVATPYSGMIFMLGFFALVGLVMEWFKP